MTNYSRRKKLSYSESFKKSVVKEVLSSNEYKTTIAKRNKVSVESIRRWMARYEDEIMSIFEGNESEEQMSKNVPNKTDESDGDLSEKELRIVQLEQALRFSKLKNEAYERLIRIAEEEYKISIKKKGGTK